jgi:hypothetical protein
MKGRFTSKPTPDQEPIIETPAKAAPEPEIPSGRVRGNGLETGRFSKVLGLGLSNRDGALSSRSPPRRAGTLLNAASRSAKRKPRPTVPRGRDRNPIIITLQQVVVPSRICLVALKTGGNFWPPRGNFPEVFCRQQGVGAVEYAF